MKNEPIHEKQRANADSSRPKKRRLYHVRNWPEYNTALVKRGDLNVWVDGATLLSWRSRTRTGRRGRPYVYSDQTICGILMLASFFRLPLRAAQGLIASLLSSLGRSDLSAPHYSTLCRRRANLKVMLSYSDKSKKETKPLRLLVDSTGLKVSGEGEWKVKKHGADKRKRRVWRKAHLAVDADTHQICAAVATGNDVADGMVLPDLLEQIEDPVEVVHGDGGYDWRSCYEAIKGREARAVIPPRKGAIIWQHGNRKDEPLDRDEALRLIRRKGRAEWKRHSGYHIRSLIETAMSRLKGIFGEGLSAIREEAQKAETLVRCAALNKITALGMPETYVVQAT